MRTDPEKIEKLARQVEKRIDVLKVFVFTSDEVCSRRSPSTRSRAAQRCEQLVRRHNVRILEIDDDYIVVEKTGYKSETRELFELLQPYGVQQFVRSARWRSSNRGANCSTNISKNSHETTENFHKKQLRLWHRSISAV